MADFLSSTNDWDLDAIIRGWGVGIQLPPPSPDLGFDGLGFDFDEPGFVGGGINELEEMYKPFVLQVEEPKHESPMSSPTETTSPSSSSFVRFDHDDDVERPNEEMKAPLDLDGENQIQAKSSSKKRKNKHKRVRVVHRGVGEDGVVVMDKWNWRKYGQKAIKGSPYPRSYYRCSSSGGCHARKHMEQSKDDPQTYIVTYIADHSHSPPTRRHAQAGRKITKFSSSNTRMKNNNNTPPCSDSMTWTVSDPWIVEDGDHRAVSTSSGFVEVEPNSFSTSFDHDWSIWEFDPFFSATSVN